MHSLLPVLVIIAVLGLIVFLIVKYVPMPQIFKNILIAVAALGLLFWILKLTGALALLAAIRI